MRLKTLFAAAAAASLVVSGPASAAGSAASLSLANGPAARVGASIEGSSDLSGRRNGIAVIIGVVLVLGALIYVVTQASKDNELPGSP